MDAAVVDVDLGSDKIDGFDITRSLRAKFPDAVICVHSNRGLMEYLGVAREAGADVFLPKPMTRVHLMRLLLSAC